ncbi:MAG: C-GCAxxG-C-C family protein [Ignavibacteriae bacterium]|nr:C-GCAxxG-C-C family protein [Ignavibacteriota bacterium]
MNHTEKALDNFKAQYNCAQSVFAAYSKKFDIKEKDAFKIASGFGGGIGRTQDICGALSGAVMVLGCRFFDEKNIPESKIIVYEKTKELISRFKEIHKTADCLELTGVDFNKEGGLELFKTLKKMCVKFWKNCYKYIL